jgi:hypothetical protein
MSSAVQQLAAKLNSLEREVRARATTPYLAFSSIEDGGAIDANNAAGMTMAQYGQQFDGSYMVGSLVGPTPPTPSAPIVTPILGGLTVQWDGLFTDALNAPMDFSRVEVHISTVSGFVPELASTLWSTIETPRGCTVVVSLPVALYYVKLVARSLSGKAGPGSEEGFGTSLGGVSTDDADARYVSLANAPIPLLASLTDSTFDALLAGLPSGAVVEIPPGVTLSLGAAHTLTQPVTIQGEGTLLDTRTSPSSAFLNIPPAASGTVITCPIAGSISATYLYDHHAINILGTDNGASVAPTFVTGLTLKPSSISNFGSTAVAGFFLKDSTIDIDVIHDMGYAGVLLMCPLNVSVNVNTVRVLTPGTLGDSYAMQFSGQDGSSDLVRYPLPKNCYGYVRECHGVADWDGMGVHGGQDIYLGFGSMYNVKHVIDVVPSTGADTHVQYAPNNVTIDIGSADSGVTDGTMGPAVVIAGAFKPGDTLGAPTEYAKGIVVRGGSLKGYGVESDINSGTYVIHSTQGLRGDFGTVQEASPYAVCLYHDNKDFMVTGCVALDPWTNSGLVAGVLSVMSTYNVGVVDNCRGTRGAKSATYVYNRGMHITSDATDVITLGAGNDFTQASDLPIYNMAYCKFGTFGVTATQAAAITTPTSDTVGTKAAIDAIRVALQNIGITA